ncbi:MAG: hypothetical protein AB8B50_14265 [Pirellulaceae bacterium]
MKYGLWVMVTLALFSGCGDGRTKFDTAMTTGTVTCDGKPVAGAMVFFEPLKDGESSVAGKSGVGVTDANGVYTISTYGTEDGAVIAKHRVRVGGSEGGGFECDCETNSEKDLMQVDVQGDVENTFDIVLPAKQKKRRGNRPTLDDDPDDDDD